MLYVAAVDCFLTDVWPSLLFGGCFAVLSLRAPPFGDALPSWGCFAVTAEGVMAPFLRILCRVLSGRCFAAVLLGRILAVVVLSLLAGCFATAASSLVLAPLR